MRILALVTSNRKKGNTARIVGMIGAHLEALAAREGKPLAFETLYLGDMDVRSCYCRSMLLLTPSLRKRRAGGKG